MTDAEVVQIAKAVDNALVSGITLGFRPDGSSYDKLVSPDEMRQRVKYAIHLEAAKLSGGACEPVAVRCDFDGFGYRYLDNGSGSDWLTRRPDGEKLYAIPPAEPAVVPARDLTTNEQGIFNRALLDSVTVVDPKPAPVADDLVERLNSAANELYDAGLYVSAKHVRDSAARITADAAVIAEKDEEIARLEKEILELRELAHN